MTFYEWTKRIAGKDSPTGDLAYDVQRDADAPTIPNTRDAWCAHIRVMSGYDPYVMAAFRSAWSSYQAYCKRHPEESQD